MNSSQLITASDLVAIAAQVDLLVANVEAHRNLGLLITTPVNPYKDSAGQSWPSSSARIVVIQVSGVKYYVPAQIVP